MLLSTCFFPTYVSCQYPSFRPSSGLDRSSSRSSRDSIAGERRRPVMLTVGLQFIVALHLLPLLPPEGHLHTQTPLERLRSFASNFFRFVIGIAASLIFNAVGPHLLFFQLLATAMARFTSASDRHAADVVDSHAFMT
ncbi:hypothetical protein GOP47_0002503 [Adiantum capillus-veneris]|uniref:Uncharacterized protein n=1 Tax=Adiantum capillus-veneris TaxID=13818 RepID=A0A9D4VB26_ADICA|nr:hypothetical protein GOP47_0002503 [Adiantum capillus-veneris]